MKKIAIVLLFLIPTSVFASGDKETVGTVVISAKAGKVFVTVSNSNTSCGNRYFFTPNTEYFRAVLSNLLAAQMSERKVWINGKGKCEKLKPYNNAYQLVNMSLQP